MAAPLTPERDGRAGHSHENAEVQRAEASASAVEEWTARLTEELGDAWGRGQRRPAEEFLSRYPGLCDHPDFAIRIIYEEVCLRQELGEEVASQEVLDRFPQWRSD